MGIEGGHAIEDSLRLLRDYYALGVRYMTLTHTNTNNWADSSGDITRTDVKHHNGLTPFGKDVVREMNRLGMMVDISHVSDKTFFDALEVSKAPIFASHSDARALANAPRNMTDEMIVALAKKGGVIHVNFNCGFLSQRFRDESAAKSTEVAARLAPGDGRKESGRARNRPTRGQDSCRTGDQARHHRRRGRAHRPYQENCRHRRDRHRHRFQWRGVRSARVWRMFRSFLT